MTLEQSFHDHRMIVPRSWNNQNGWVRVLLFLYADGNKIGEKGLSGIVDGRSLSPHLSSKASGVLSGRFVNRDYSSFVAGFASTPIIANDPYFLLSYLLRFQKALNYLWMHYWDANHLALPQTGFHQSVLCLYQ